MNIAGIYRLLIFALALLIATAALYLAGCGKGGADSIKSRQMSQPLSGGGERADLEWPQMPEGVDDGLWSALKAEFLENLEASRTVSSPPQNAPLADVQWLSAPGSSLVLRWQYQNFGDYDLNGEVGVSDITPIALNYLVSADESELAAWIDRSGDGVAGISDVTHVALNYLNSVEGYLVEYFDIVAGGYAEAGKIEFDAETGVDRSLVPYQFAFDVPGEIPFESWLRVRAFHGEELGPPSESVRISNIPNPGEIVLKETWEGGDGTIENADNKWTIEGPQGDKEFDWAVVTDNPVLVHGAIEGQKFVRWDTGLNSGIVGQNAQRWVKTGPVTIHPDTEYRISFYTNGQTAQVFYIYVMAGLRVQYSFDDFKWFDATNYKLDYGYDYEKNVYGIGHAKLVSSEGNWRLHKYWFNSGENSQLYFRYGFESSPYYIDDDIERYPNNGGPCLDDLTIMQPEIPPDAVWFEDFESGDMGQWDDGGGLGMIFEPRTSQIKDGPDSAKSGAYFCAPSPSPYRNNAWRRMKSGPVALSIGEQYEVAFFTAGLAESNWDGLLVGYSFDGEEWNWLGEDFFYGHDSVGYSGFSKSLGRTEWIPFDAVFTADSDTLYIGIGFESDNSIQYAGPCLDLMSVRPYVPIP